MFPCDLHMPGTRSRPDHKVPINFDTIILLELLSEMYLPFSELIDTTSTFSLAQHQPLIAYEI